MPATPRLSLWFPYLRSTSQARIRLFCFPYAGGAASIYRSWSDLLPSEIDVWSVQLPGRENRLMEHAIDNLTDLVALILPTLLPYIDMPYAFFGHSMGASISFELACAFHRLKYPAPVHLFLSGRRAPQIEPRDLVTYTLSDAEFIEKLRRLEGTPEEVLHNDELLQLLLPVIRADFKLSETCRYQPVSLLTCPISAYGGLQDKEVTREDIEMWKKETKGAFILRMFPGNHFFLHSSQVLLLQTLTSTLLLPNF